MKKKGTGICLNWDRKPFITPSLHLCVWIFCWSCMNAQAYKLCMRTCHVGMGLWMTFCLGVGIFLFPCLSSCDIPTSSFISQKWYFHLFHSFWFEAKPPQKRDVARYTFCIQRYSASYVTKPQKQRHCCSVRKSSGRELSRRFRHRPRMSLAGPRDWGVAPRGVAHMDNAPTAHAGNYSPSAVKTSRSTVET